MEKKKDFLLKNISSNKIKKVNETPLKVEDIRVYIRHLGAVANALAMFEKMELLEVIDRYCPPDARNHLTRIFHKNC